MNSQNREKITLNPVTGDLQLVNDLEMGFSVRNVVKAPIHVNDGYTRVYPNMQVAVGLDVEVRDGGELIIL